MYLKLHFWERQERSLREHYASEWFRCTPAPITLQTFPSRLVFFLLYVACSIRVSSLRASVSFSNFDCTKKKMNTPCKKKSLCCTTTTDHPALLQEKRDAAHLPPTHTSRRQLQREYPAALVLVPSDILQLHDILWLMINPTTMTTALPHTTVYITPAPPGPISRTRYLHSRNINNSVGAGRRCKHLAESFPKTYRLSLIHI